jgi:hypothetical protein
MFGAIFNGSPDDEYGAMLEGAARGVAHLAQNLDVGRFAYPHFGQGFVEPDIGTCRLSVNLIFENKLVDSRSELRTVNVSTVQHVDRRPNERCDKLGAFLGRPAPRGHSNQFRDA